MISQYDMYLNKHFTVTAYSLCSMFVIYSSVSIKIVRFCSKFIHFVNYVTTE